jgi:ACR3 family arsenite efflux pump ArsB
MTSIVHLSDHVKKYLIVYTILSTISALPIGYYFKAVIISNKALISDLIVILAILTIYPSMIQLKTEGFLKSFKSWKQITLSMIYVFFLSPLIAFLMAPTMGDPHIGIGYVIANVVPASSASLGYVLIAGGNIELATALAILSIFIGIPAIPLLVSRYSNMVSVPVPIETIIASLLEVLVLPLIVGQLTRYVITRSKGLYYVDKIMKPHLSLATMLSMLALVFVLVLNQAIRIITNSVLAILILAYQSIVILALLAISLLISRALHIPYEDHQAIALISVTKNQSVAAAIAVSALGPWSALAPALIPMIQPILVIAYFYTENNVKKLLSFTKEPVKMKTL